MIRFLRQSSRVALVTTCSRQFSWHSHFRTLPLTTKLKYTALTIGGIGGVCILTSFGIVILGLGGLVYGGYSLYNHIRPSAAIPSHLMRQQYPKGSLKASVPYLMLQSLIRVIGIPIQQSMERSQDIQSMIHEKLKANTQVMSLFPGKSIVLYEPEQLSESTVNGKGKWQAVFPVYSTSQERLHANVYAEVVINPSKAIPTEFQKLELHEFGLNKRINLLKQEESIIDAEYKDI